MENTIGANLPLSHVAFTQYRDPIQGPRREGLPDCLRRSRWRHAEEFHLISDVLPGTVTRMTCGALKNGGEWRLMNPDTGETWAAQPDPAFRAALNAINPHLNTSK